MGKCAELMFLLSCMFFQVAGVPGVREAIFLARQSALAEEKEKLNETPLLYACGLCDKEYRSSKAHAQHLKSKSHLARASQQPGHHDDNSVTIKPLLRHPRNETPRKAKEDVEESDESEWEEVDPDEEMISEATDSLTDLKMNEHTSNCNMDEDSGDECGENLDPSCCFMCDKEHKTIESCMVHMHKKHGFFIPDVEYLKDPKGFLTYLGLKVEYVLPLSLFFPAFLNHFLCSRSFPFSLYRSEGIYCACIATTDAYLSAV